MSHVSYVSFRPSQNAAVFKGYGLSSKAPQSQAWHLLAMDGFSRTTKKRERKIGMKWEYHILYFFVYMSVSENGGTPKSSILIGFSIINHPIWGTPIFGNTHMNYLLYIYIYIFYLILLLCPKHALWVLKKTCTFSEPRLCVQRPNWITYGPYSLSWSLKHPDLLSASNLNSPYGCFQK